MHNAYITDLALTLLKSTPSKVTLDRTNEEMFVINSSQLEKHETSKPHRVRMFHQSLWLPYSNPVYPKRTSVLGELRTWTRYFGLAVLVSYPKDFDPDRQRYNECPISIDLDFDILKQDGFVTDDNNFVDQIATCRALYSWMACEDLESSNPVVLERETQTSLPPGDYVFRITPVAYVGTCEFVPRDVKIENFGEYRYNDWATKVDAEHLSRSEISWDPHEYEILDLLKQKDVIVRLSKSPRHTTSGSVDTKKSKGRKDKITQEQDSPDLQLGL